ncbi:MAG: hypothetical protein MRZ48_07855, partial [Anaerostipes hadrus]|nr:hypothetical protein [Anaerostipes hadrus]
QMNKRKVYYFNKYMKISVRILFLFVLNGIIREGKESSQQSIPIPIRGHIDIKIQLIQGKIG